MHKQHCPASNGYQRSIWAFTRTKSLITTLFHLLIVILYPRRYWVIFQPGVHVWIWFHIPDVTLAILILGGALLLCFLFVKLCGVVFCQFSLMTWKEPHFHLEFSFQRHLTFFFLFISDFFLVLLYPLQFYIITDFFPFLITNLTHFSASTF